MTHVHAVAAGVVLAVVIGLGFHLLDRRRTHAILRRELDQANARADALAAELGSVKVDLAIADQAVEDLLAQVAEALRIIADLSDARIADADRWPVPPDKWVALQEARENWEAN